MVTLYIYTGGKKNLNTKKKLVQSNEVTKFRQYIRLGNIFNWLKFQDHRLNYAREEPLFNNVMVIIEKW